MTRKFFFRAILGVVVIVALYRIFESRPEQSLTHLTGITMGTIAYNVKYLEEEPENYQRPIDSLLSAFNQSLSTYISDSEISRLNGNGHLKFPSNMFLDVLKASRNVYELSDGAFDPTVGPLVNIWGFGPEKKIHIPDSSVVDSIKSHTGFEKIVFSDTSVSFTTATYLDFSAIAKGYAVDLVAEYLESKSIKNYMVEIGGEVRARGTNDQSEIWRIGVENPKTAVENRELIAIISLQDKAMATSGNYRNYYVSDGQTIAHTIDPRTGYNTRHNLLSASVFADNCMQADAFATAFMVLGLDQSKALLSELDLEAYLIYEVGGELKSYVTPVLQESVKKNTLQ